MRQSRLDALAIALMVTLCAIWGMNQVAAKVANASIPPILQAGLRSAGAVLLLWAWSAWRRVPLFDRDGTLGAGLLAGAMFAAEFALIFKGLDYTTAARGVVFLYTAPFVVAAGMHLLVPAERLTRTQSAGLAAAFLGIVVAFGEALTATDPDQWIGDAMLLAAALLWGATTLVVRNTVLGRVRAEKALFYQLAVSALALPTVSAILDEPGLGQPTPLAWASLAWQIAGVAFASYLAWFWLITRYPATRLSAFSFLTPLFGVLFGAALLGEPVTWPLVAGLALVAAGIWLVNAR